MNVPDVIGLSQTDAEAAIIAAGLRVGTISPSESTSTRTASGKVVDQNPPPGASVEPGSPVDLVVSPSCANTPFASARELQIAVDDYLSDNSAGTDVANMYGHPINTWCVGAVTDFSDLFASFRNLDAPSFNEDIGSWDVSRAVNFQYMFYKADAFNQNLDSWDTSSVTDMQSMFRGATAVSHCRLICC